MTQNVFEKLLPKQVWIPSETSLTARLIRAPTNTSFEEFLSFFQSTNLYRMNKTLPQNQIYNM